MGGTYPYASNSVYTVGNASNVFIPLLSSTGMTPDLTGAACFILILRPDGQQIVLTAQPVTSATPPYVGVEAPYTPPIAGVYQAQARVTLAGATGPLTGQPPGNFVVTAAIA